VGCLAGYLMSDVLLYNIGAAWRMTVKELMHRIADHCMGGEKMSLTYSSLSSKIIYVLFCQNVLDSYV